MGEVRGNQPQLPADPISVAAGESERDLAAFARGVDAGREWARRSTQRALAWIEDHPGQALLLAVGAGFVLGKLLFRPEPEEDE
jgi:ElaB/YqjD/DUF883 family membrane-anchored ribosome-binding protein